MNQAGNEDERSHSSRGEDLAMASHQAAGVHIELDRVREKEREGGLKGCTFIL